MIKDTSDGGALPFDETDVLDVPLGDLMRGERATLGKSLLDVERDLKIKAAHIAAIENADLSVFATKGFVAGYVRSYARYLGMDPEWTFRRFSQEAGFYGVHGESAAQARGAKRAFGDAPKRVNPNDVMSTARVSFAPERESIFSRLEPGALGSALVLLALVGVIGASLSRVPACTWDRKCSATSVRPSVPRASISAASSTSRSTLAAAWPEGSRSASA